MIVIIPLNNEEIRYEESVVLENIDYKFFIDWNDCEQFWYLSIKDENNNYIKGIIGIKIVVNWPLNRMVSDQNFLKGVLLAINKDNEDPKLNNLKLVYCTSDEWEDIRATV
jgi:hypothetical protein